MATPNPFLSTALLRRCCSSTYSTTTSTATAFSTGGISTSQRANVLRISQRRWARVHDVRFVTTQRQADQVLDRYRAKLEDKARAEGHESVSGLKDSYKDKISELKKNATVPVGIQSGTATSSPQTSGSTFTQPPPPPPSPQPEATIQNQPSEKKKKSSSDTPGVKPLSSYLDLEKVASLSKKELEYVWRLRHADDPLSLCAAIPLETYQRIYRTARIHPQFVLPLPRPTADDGSGDVKQSEQGFEGGERSAADIHFLQWGFHPPAGPPAAPDAKTTNTHTSTVLFTHLAAYKLHGSYAQPHTAVIHHLDLADSHGLVLLSGSVTEGRGVSVEESRWLLMCLQKFYDHGGHGGGIGLEKRQSLLQKFSSGDQGFDLAELVDEAERIS